MILIPVVNQVGNDNYTIESVQFENGSIKIGADIYVPKQPLPSNIGIALIQGSGESGRDNQWSKEHAQFLSENGFHVLLPDKRGVGSSTGSWKSASYEDLASDAINSQKFLKSKYNLSKVGLMGLSEGGRVATIAAALDSTIDFLVTISSSSLSFKESIIHEMINTAIQEGLNSQEIEKMLYLHVLLFNYAENNDWSPLEQFYAEQKESSWAEFVQTFPTSPNDWRFQFIKKNLNYNPIAYFQKLTQNAFIAYGSEDIQDNVPVFRSIFNLQSVFEKIKKINYQIHTYPSGHGLRDSKSGELLKQYKSDLTSWLLKQ
jgi:pimeloyl-ACP methyl ester carboxylesterase